ncbi:TraI/MobA(P) family conjugative relaxase [Desulfovibrio sp.]|uniref:TraI/MobA(P) family conjugative relaxase n=1 Tax=Desulfovibrio sp. TaxID=885 RepID=UPI0025BC3C5D|nr:TraI/MobA(P) family conjugative relaxase [Desulfovibrio sp.]
MISKKVGISPKNDNYARLADYIADAGHEGEKSLMHWCAGCLGDEDYRNGIAEAVDVQAMNTRTAKSKTYHIVISFRPEDEAKLTPEVFKAIEERFAAALGYTDHQRHCGVHQNTANLHMHVAYNTIHPEKHTRHEPFRDYRTRDRVCRELEQEYGLVVDNGRDKGKQRSLGEKAALIEAHTGQQSFESYAKTHRDAILHVLPAAPDWQPLHEELARYGMDIKPHGSGLVIADRHNQRHTVKASSVSRDLSLKRLEEKLGPYLPARALEKMTEQSRYQHTPLHRSPERGALFAEYQHGIEKRKTGLATVKEREDAALSAIKGKWADKRRELERLNIAKKNRRNLLQLARKHEADETARAKLPFQSPREAIRGEIPFTSWNSFLQQKADQGNETALAILRSKREAAEPDREPQAAVAKDWSQHGKEQFAANRAEIRAEYAAKELAALENKNVSAQGKKQLLAVLRMEQLAAEEAAHIRGFSATVDRKGTVIFALPGGGRILDSGRELFFSGNNDAARHVAVRYAQKKWGKSLHVEGNKIVRLEKKLEKEQVQKQQQNMER